MGLQKEPTEELGRETDNELTAPKDQLIVESKEPRQRALDNLASLNWTLPEGYKFDRDEANAG